MRLKLLAQLVARRSKKLRDHLLLDRAQRDYLRLLRETQAVDADHYRRTHAPIHAFFLRDPARHYVSAGERMGLSPRTDFVPGSYIRLNPGKVDEDQPLGHWLRDGRSQQLATVEPEPTVLPSFDVGTSGSQMAMHVHVFYLDLWPEIEQSIEVLLSSCDLWVTVTDQAGAEKLRSSITQRHASANVLIVPNRGRDWLPFMHLLNRGAFERHAAVLKIHTKRSDHRADGATWRQRSIDALVDVAETDAFQHFLRDDRATVMAPDSVVPMASDLWGMNRPRLRELHRLTGGTDLPDELPPFPIGSMFWAKPQLLDSLARLALTPDDFDPELGQLDGTTAHALERLVGLVAAETSQHGFQRIAGPGAAVSS